MKRSREELASLLKGNFTANIGNKKKNAVKVNEIFDKYGLPTEITSDVISLKKDPIDLPDNYLYYLSDIFLNNADKFFTDAEIKAYSNSKYKETKITFPIRWNMIEIAPDQWIGKVNLSELMMLRDAQLIYYNENTQRTLRHIQTGNSEYYQISLNRTAVNAITESYNNGSYIPNTITLNLPEEADFKYSDGKLIIRETPSLDIIDGYHRYIAMSNIYNQDSEFDYPMELRVVCFTEEKAKQFIWQEDQKTKMRKLDSDTFNQNNPANQVIDLINQQGLLRNVIGRNSGAIDSGYASRLISVLYFNGKNTSNRKTIIETKIKLVDKLNTLLNSDAEVFDKKWDYYQLMAAFVLFTEDIDDDKLLKEINEFAERCRDPKLQSIVGRPGVNISSRLISRLRKLYKEV